MTTERHPNKQAILNSPDTSYWLKDAIETLSKRDPVDSYYDALALAEIMKRDMDIALGR